MRASYLLLSPTYELLVRKKQGEKQAKNMFSNTNLLGKLPKDDSED